MLSENLRKTVSRYTKKRWLKIKENKCPGCGKDFKIITNNKIGCIKCDLEISSRELEVLFKNIELLGGEFFLKVGDKEKNQYLNSMENWRIYRQISYENTDADPEGIQRGIDFGDGLPER